MSDFLRRASNTGVVGVAVFAMLLMTGTERAVWAQSVFGPTSSFGPFIPQAQLPATGPTAISGDTALVAADGGVHVFERDPATDAWAEAALLTPSDGAVDFGRAVAIEGVRAIVGADGAAYIFRRRSDGVWREVIRLAASDGNADFGASVDIDGNHAIVGAPAPSLLSFGAAYVFARNPGGAPRWTEVARLPGDYRSFGSVLGISGDTAIVGSPRGTFGGNAFLYGRDQDGPENWGLLKRLLMHTGGSDVAIDGDTAMVAGAEISFGCWHEIYRRNIGGPNGWGREPKQRSEPCAANGYRSSAISGDKAIFLFPPYSFNPSYGRVIARNQGTLDTAWFYPPEIGGPNSWGAVSRFALPSGPPRQPPAMQLTSSSISGDTALIAVSSSTAPYIGHVEVLVSDEDGDGIRDGRDPCVRDPLNNVAGGCQRASAQYPVLDDLISQDDVTTETRNNRFIITATFTNTSQSAVKNPFFEVTELTGRNVLINSDAGRGGVGATISPDVGDGVLSPGESMAVEFVIRLRTRDAFEFRVTFRGEPAS